MQSQNTNANRKTIVVGADVVKVINIEAGKFYRYRFETPRLALPVTVPSAAPFPELFFASAILRNQNKSVPLHSLRVCWNW